MDVFVLNVWYNGILYNFVYLAVGKYSKQNLLHCNKGSSITVETF